MARRSRLGWLAVALAVSGSSALSPAFAQQQPVAPAPQAPGLEAAQHFMNRMVRVTGRVLPNGSAAVPSGYGFIVGERKTADGKSELIIVTADHLVRDPVRTDTQYAAPRITFWGNLAISVDARLLDQHLAPEDGDVAVLAVDEPLNAMFSPATMASAQTLQPGDAAWEIGRPGGWDPAASQGRFALRQPTGWLLFEGLDAALGSAGGPVLVDAGLAGMVTTESSSPTTPNRVVPVELIAAKMAEWGLPWQIQPPAAATVAARPAGSLASLTDVPGPAGASSGMPAVDSNSPAPASQPAPPPPPLVPQRPSALVVLLPSDAAARASWVPPDARLSPWAQRPATLLASPRRGAAVIGSIPQGTSLPSETWARGIYTVQSKLDGGAWFLAAAGGQAVGYVSGNDVIEVWPAPTAAPMGKVVRDWVTSGGHHAVLRDAGTHYDLTFTLTCGLDHCNTINVFSPTPPEPGAILPPFQVPAMSGDWDHGANVDLHVLLPRHLVDTKGALLMDCIGQDIYCDAQTLLTGG